MGRKYEVIWTQSGTKSFENTVEFGIKLWTPREANRLIERIQEVTEVLQSHPMAFPKIRSRKNLQSVLLIGPIGLVYGVKGERVTIYGLFDHRQNPKKLSRFG